MTEPFVVNRITFKNTRLVDENEKYHTNIGVYEAKKHAQDVGLQLVCFAMNGSELPLCKILDFGKWRYENEKAQKKMKLENKHEVKEVKFSARTEDGDLTHKIKHVMEFLQEGCDVSLQMKIEGRDLEHMDIANAKMDSVVNKLNGIATMLNRKTIDGRKKYIVVNLTKAKIKEKE